MAAWHRHHPARGVVRRATAVAARLRRCAAAPTGRKRLPPRSQGRVRGSSAGSAPLTDPAAHGGDPADAVHLVVPSLPGYGFSGPTPDGGWYTQRMAAAIAELVRRLGYDRYLVHGGDWGSAVARDLGVLDREHLLGLHLTMTVGLQAQDPQTDDERAAAQKARHYAAELSGYNKLQGTRPLSLTAALTDSPTGLLAWITERFDEWTDPGSEIDTDQLLTNVAVYWFTGTAGSSAQLYWERQHGPAAQWADDVPTGVTVLPHDLFRPTREVVEQAVDLVSWTELDRGGHFPAMEVPDLLVHELRQFASRVR